MTDYLRFPRTPHLMWLGRGEARGDKVLSPQEAEALLARPVIVEEKVDGANVGFSLDAHGKLRAQNRGHFLEWDAPPPQFRTLADWVARHRDTLTPALAGGLILFGEWCYARHSIEYTRLPDWFVAFDVYDRDAERFWSVERRDALVKSAGLACVPEVARGQFDRRTITALLGPSRFTDGPAEGIYLRRDDGPYLEVRAKLVRAEFTQAIGEHWSRGQIQRNRLAPPA